MPAKPFKPDSLIYIYIMDIGPTPARGYVNTPNLVYKSLDVGTRYLSTITNFVGQVVTLPLGHVVTLV